MNAMPAEKLDPGCMEELAALLGDRFTTSQAVRDHHGQGEAYHTPASPLAVAFPHSTEEVQAVVKICAAHKMPVIPYGAGTSLEGQTLATHGGITLDMTQMDNILRVSAEDLDCTVQPGVTREQLNTDLRDTGLFFPIDPGANASIGGMTGTRASGTNAVRYGTMRENVLGLTVVLANGEVIKTGGRALKSSAGYDLTRVFVGSEGSLGVITEITLRLYGIPEAISSAVCAFPGLEEAVNTCILTIQTGVPVARIELVDDITIQAMINYSKLEGFEPKTYLFFEFHGSEASVKEQAETVEMYAKEYGGSDFRWTAKAEERNKMWKARHDVHFANKAMRPSNQQGMATDVCVPISRLAECIMETKRDMEASGRRAGFVGHVGDGNFHTGVAADYSDPDERAAAFAFHERLVKRALAMGGTCTGEHGIGSGKMKYMEMEHGAGAVEAMRALKRTFDPDNIMNPGKVVEI
ncbi:MAG: FAD-linked oxidase C-terminal domain-containing protein [Alphaproteobacteria bacterium]